jgi:hypothetical protein
VLGLHLNRGFHIIYDVLLSFEFRV